VGWDIRAFTPVFERVKKLRKDPSPLVPAKAGTQSSRKKEQSFRLHRNGIKAGFPTSFVAEKHDPISFASSLDPRVRGDEREGWYSNNSFTGSFAGYGRPRDFD
jgi:hypothetical protein